MGKGFCATHGVEGQDLSALIMRACNERGLPVDLRAIVNDGAATLLAQAYRDPMATRISLICGTGTNAAVFLPVRALANDKFGRRDSGWFAAADRVLVNTELSMLGGGENPALPRSKWDVQLNAHHRLPDFQPLEYLTTGRYLGEIVRLILVDAVTTCGMFGGIVPLGLSEAYTLDTRLLAPFEQEQSADGLTRAAASFLQAHPIGSTTSGHLHAPTIAEWTFVRDIIQLVTHRAAAYLAVALHALWRVRVESEVEASMGSPVDPRVTIACHGTIIERYPGYRERCQQVLDRLCAAEGETRPGTILLAVAPESSIFGAAVAVGCLEGWEG
jgi:hexokinase